MYHFWITHPMRFNPRLSTGRWKLVACVACSWSFNLLGFQWFSWKIEAMPDLSRFKIIKATCFFFYLVTFRMKWTTTSSWQPWQLGRNETWEMGDGLWTFWWPGWEIIWKIMENPKSKIPEHWCLIGNSIIFHMICDCNKHHGHDGPYGNWCLIGKIGKSSDHRA